MSQILGRMEFVFWIPFGLEAMHRNYNPLEFRVLQVGFLVTLLGWKIPMCVALNVTDGGLLLHYTGVTTEANSVFQQPVLQQEDSN